MGFETGFETGREDHVVSKSMQEDGEKLIGQGEAIFRREVQSAYGGQDFNLTVRRAQEVVKLALKGGLKVLGVDYPRVHERCPCVLGIGEAENWRQ